MITLNTLVMAAKVKDYNKKVVSVFRKEMSSLRKDEIEEKRRSVLKFFDSLKLLSESKKKREDEEYAVSSIRDCNLTRLKGSDGFYAIGDSGGKPITGFDFVYVSRNSLGENDCLIEVITKSGRNEYYNADI